MLRQGQTLISFFWPAQNEDLLEAWQDKGAKVIAMDMVRASRAPRRWTRSPRWPTSPATAP